MILFSQRPHRPVTRGWRSLRLGLTLLAVALVTSGCSRDNAEEALRFGFPEPATKQGEDVLNLWIGSTLAALGVGVFVWGLIFYAIIVYRKRSDDLPAQVRYNLPIEVLYTVVPFVIVGVLFYYTTVSEQRVNELTDDPDVTIGVVGYRWGWVFNYLDRDAQGRERDIQVVGNTENPPQLVLPTDRTIRFVETSPDVIHSFWVPAFLFKRDVVPGRSNQFELTIEEEGTFIGRCAELCGVDHSRMNFSVKSIPGPEYDAFLDERTPAAAPAVPLPAPAAVAPAVSQSTAPIGALPSPGSTP